MYFKERGNFKNKDLSIFDLEISYKLWLCLKYKSIVIMFLFNQKYIYTYCQTISTVENNLNFHKFVFLFYSVKVFKHNIKYKTILVIKKL